jgi:hypothetical protein
MSASWCVPKRFGIAATIVVDLGELLATSSPSMPPDANREPGRRVVPAKIHAALAVLRTIQGPRCSPESLPKYCVRRERLPADRDRASGPTGSSRLRA